MPRRLVAPCSHPYCPRLAEIKGKCRTHASNYDKELKAKAGYRSIYGTKDWRRIKAKILTEQSICRCGRLTTEVDHIIPLKAGGRSTIDNLQALCKSCHSAKTKKELSIFRN